MAPLALVTGANRGLGLETSNQLHQQGFHVILTSRKESAGMAATKKLDPEGELKPIETVRGRGYRFAIPRSE